MFFAFCSGASFWCYIAISFEYGDRADYRAQSKGIYYLRSEWGDIEGGLGIPAHLWVLAPPRPREPLPEAVRHFVDPGRDLAPCVRLDLGKGFAEIETLMVKYIIVSIDEA